MDFYPFLQGVGKFLEGDYGIPTVASGAGLISNLIAGRDAARENRRRLQALDEIRSLAASPVDYNPYYTAMKGAYTRGGDQALQAAARAEARNMAGRGIQSGALYNKGLAEAEGQADAAMMQRAIELALQGRGSQLQAMMGAASGIPVSQAPSAVTSFLDPWVKLAQARATMRALEASRRRYGTETPGVTFNWNAAAGAKPTLDVGTRAPLGDPDAFYPAEAARTENINDSITFGSQYGRVPQLSLGLSQNPFPEEEMFQ